MKLNKPLLLLTVLLLMASAFTWWLIPAEPDFNGLVKMLIVFSLLAAGLVSFGLSYWYRSEKEQDEQQHEQSLLLKQDIQTINQLFKSAVKQLRGVRGNKLNSLYELPWYVLIGGETDAKSSLLQQNNLEPVLHRAHDASDTDQYVRFWSNDNLVVIEVGHRLFDSDGIDDSLWRAFAKQLLKYRPRQAANGVVTAIGCDRLLQGDKKARQILSTNLQEAILTLGEHTGLSLPVYSIFTKSDSISDFVDFFTSYSGCDVENPFGLSFSMDDSRRFNPHQFESDSKQLLKSLSQQQFQLLREVHQDSSSSVIALPYQLRIFFERANELLTNIGRENRVRQAVWLRGMYLVSTGQKGASYDLLTQLVAEQGSFNANSVKSQVPSRKSLFASRIFNNVIAPEADAVGVNEVRHHSYIAARSALVIALFGVITLFGLQLKDNWNLDEEFRGNATTQLSLYRNDIERLRDGRSGLAEVIPVLNELRLVAEQGNQPVPWYQKVSIKQTQTAEQIYQGYQQQLQLFLLPQLADVLSSELYVYVNLGNPSKVFELLRYYQMLFDKQRLDQQEMVDYLVDTLNDQGDISADSLNNLGLLMADLFGSSYDKVLEANSELISVAAQNLEGLSPERLIYARLKAMPEYRTRVDIRRQLGEKFGSMFRFKNDFHGYLLQELYTRQGHSNIDLSVKSPLLKKQLEEFKSIQGDMSGVSIAELTALSKKVQRLYYADYVYQWKELVNNIEVKEFTSMADLAYAVKIAREPANSPLIDVLDALVVNTTLATEKTPDTKGTTKAARQLGLKSVAKVAKKADKINKVGGEKLLRLQPAFVVNEAFSSYSTFMGAESEVPPVNELITEFDNLNTYFDSALSSSEPGKAMYANAKAHAAGSQDPLVTFRRQSSRAPGQVADWIKSLDDQAWSHIISSSSVYLNRQWKERVYSFYRQAIEGRFPFSLQGRGEVALDDFANLFKPQGRIDTFITEELQPFAYWDNGVLKLAEIDGERLPIKADMLRKLKQAKDIRELFFGPTGQELALQLRLKASSMSTSTTQFDIREAESLFAYRHGPRLWQNIAWPTTGEDGYISANFYNGENRTASKSYTGQWAIFRMLFDGQSSSTGDRRIRNLVYKLEKDDIVLQYALKDSNRALNKGLLTSFYLPSSL
ncbi:type VI secretion system membrane subunit TssM [Vibrio sp. Of7-15]|uniref:type VI secretion system membrane subunit TssM n=1 Tax=Vibrio sp. Of7-15 TaxID=2724879 RepID=UPI001EF180C0|nr:type VI secretion system membrane subunit TssM [Vibrio sp. Of7-15]MCG7496203.1 type VI secretion system membrane subunit TssM [Vibrio sp. Of7-15]